MSTPTTADVLAKLQGYPSNLRWSDFRSVATSPKPPHEAQTFSRYSYSYATEHRLGVYRVKSVRVTVTKGGVSMWAVTGASRTNDLLKHEQGHFDITGLIARDLCRDLLSIEYEDFILDSMIEAGNTARSKQTYANSVLSADAQRAITDASDLQALLQGRETQGGGHTDGQYDDDTNHSQNAVGQQKWNDILQYSRLNDTSLKLAMMIFGSVKVFAKRRGGVC